MSIDLEWAKLDSSLANYLVDVLNRQLTNAERPSFIGPVEVTSLEFGSAAPDVELVDLRDIYRDFLEDDDDSDFSGDPTRTVKVTEGLNGGGHGPGGGDDDDGFEWVPRRAAAREFEGIAQSHLPPHLRYPLRSAPTDTFSSLPQFHHNPMSMVGLDMWTGHGALFAQHHPTTPQGPLFRSPSPSTPFPAGVLHTPPLPPPPQSGSADQPQLSDSSFLQRPTNALFPAPPTQPTAQQQNPHPNLQLHLHVNWHSNLRITITTSLLINYPSPMFMSLPIKLSVTGLVFNGELAVAYEGERRRVHMCILDDLDPYGPAGDRPKREPTTVTPPELDEDSPPAGGGRPPKPLPVGQRLLPSIFIESEIGQTDKHVLKNVTRVERFIQDVIRKTVEEELVFPNFHTLVMGDGQ